MSGVSEIRARLYAGDRDEALEALTAAWPQRPARAEILPWANLAQEAGRADLALALLREGLIEHPDAPELRVEYLALLEDLGLEEGGEVSPASAPTPPPARDPLLEPTRADIARLLHLFAGREGVYARQWSDERGAGYSPVRAPLTPELWRAHLAGSITLGAYVVRVDQTVTFFALDLDIRRKALEGARGHPAQIEDLRARVARAGLDLRAQALELGLPLLLEDSGFKGRHLWGFLEQPLPADLIHKLGRRLLRALRLDDIDLSLEFFPKQARVEGDGLGNLIKLPLGIHRRTGRRAALLDAEGAPIANPWTTLREAPRLARDQLLDTLGRLREAPPPPEVNTPAHEAPLEPPPPPHDAEALEALLAGCPVLAHLLDRGLRTRRLSHSEQVVLIHTMGHLEAGVARLNQAFERCPEIPQRTQLKRPMRGHPISCARIRQRIPALTAQQPCHCAFEPTDSDYPNPLIHTQRPIARPAQPPDGRALSAALEALPEQTLVMPGGRWVLEDGRPVWRIEAP